MKKIIYTIVVLFILNSSFLILNSFAQWQPDVRLTNNNSNSQTSNNNTWCVAANGNIVHVVWYDSRDGNAEIYYKSSSDAGVSWGVDTRLTNNSSRSENPSIAVSGSTLHIVWIDQRNSDWEIYYKRSTDGGISWGADVRLTNNTSVSILPSIAVSGSVVHVIWDDNRDGDYEVYYKRSTDGGTNWGADMQFTNTTNFYGNKYPSVAVSGSTVHVVWNSYRDQYNYYKGIFYKRSSDGGLSWSGELRLTNIDSSGFRPSISASGQNVNVVFTSLYLLYLRSINGGLTWGNEMILTNSSTSSQLPSVAVSNANIHVVWVDRRDNNFEIYYKGSANGGLTWGADTRLTNNTASSEDPSIAVSGSNVHVVWEDYRDGSGGEIYYKRNPTGNSIGIHNISTEIPSKYSLGQNYPNPFNPTTNIKFQVKSAGVVKLGVLDILGKEITTLVNEKLQPGTYETTFDGSNFTSGIYFYRLETNNIQITRKCILLK